MVEHIGLQEGVFADLLVNIIHIWNKGTIVDLKGTAVAGDKHFVVSSSLSSLFFIYLHRKYKHVCFVSTTTH